jgi:hypothetical protein
MIMMTLLRAERAAPRDERSLLVELEDAVRGLKDDRPTLHLGIANSAGQLYREITVHGPLQYRAVRDCFLRRGFRLRPGGAQLIAHFERIPDDLHEPYSGSWDDE